MSCTNMHQATGVRQLGLDVHTYRRATCFDTPGAPSELEMGVAPSQQYRRSTPRSRAQQCEVHACHSANSSFSPITHTWPEATMRDCPQGKFQSYYCCAYI